MLAERISRGRPRSLRSMSIALAIGLGLAAPTLAAAPVAAADAGVPVQLAIAVPIVVPAGNSGLISGDTLAQYTAPFGLLTRELDAAINRPVALAIDPMIIVSIRVLGSSAPQSAVSWLARLAGATNETFSLAYADGDVTLGMQAGTSTVLGPQSLDYAIDPALFAPANQVAPTPSPTGTPAPGTVPPLPASVDLLSWDYSLTGIAWPRNDTAIASDLPTITASGYSTTILRSTNVDHPSSAGPSVDVGGSGVVVSDAVVSDALDTAAQSLSASTWQTAVAALSGAVASEGAAQSGATPTVFATLDRVAPVSGSRLADTLDALAQNPAVQLVPMSQVITQPQTGATVIDKPQAPERVAVAKRMLEAEAAEQEFAHIAADPQAITSPRRLQLLGLFSNSWLTNTAGWPGATADFLARSTDLRSSVQLAKGSNFLLIADNSQFLPITVSNALNQPVTVYVEARPSSGLMLVENPRVELVIPANAQAKVDVPVRSLSNGVVEVSVSLSSTSGLPIGSSISNEVNVQAGWETPIVIAFAALVVLVFGFGIVRTVIRRRRASHD